jgi:hypothetical protein
MYIDFALFRSCANTHEIDCTACSIAAQLFDLVQASLLARVVKLAALSAPLSWCTCYELKLVLLFLQKQSSCTSVEQHPMYGI